ncbi:uncharacterized protein F4812DRAFT_414743 [Daldinia caldariorum]|uniref:uncharacterized protein n=1 Tax=Daldinia caldariorum TaxID=326644 RepID=UPI0020077E6D|nr:uncharacterized protein F4812DRAFT_414743 [Daldinia caldariorum]KAI1471606.1 hypothetical protein F4812DRAFT_414743 [Daldinia caldariorum]
MADEYGTNNNSRPTPKLPGLGQVLTTLKPLQPTLQHHFCCIVPEISPNITRPMKISSVFSGLAALALASAASTTPDRTVAIYIQPVTGLNSPAPAPAPLAEIRYNPGAAAPEASIAWYEAPELPEEARLVRVGVYDAAGKRWASSTSVASVDNFGKGYSPTLVLSVDQSSSSGEPFGVALKGVRIDAGQTRDFGPRAMLLVTEPGRQPELNKPIVLSPEGKTVVPEEKTFFQKYWWLIGIVVMMTLSGGGGGGEQSK